MTEPYGSGFGGGGFWLLYDSKADRYLVIDARETAPEKISKIVSDGPLAAGIPGQVAAITYLANHYGTMPLRQTLKAAIHYAKKGFPVNDYYQQLAAQRLTALNHSPAASKTFLEHGKVPELDTIIKQPQLAKLIKLIGKKGRDGFYKGKVAKTLVKAVVANGGVWQLKDLQN